MEDRENAEKDNQHSETHANQPLSGSLAQSASHSDKVHGCDVHAPSNHKPEPPKQWFRNPDWYMVILNGLLVSVGIITAVFLYRQFGQMAAQTKILSDQSKQVAADSVRASDDMKKQLGFAGEQTKAAHDSVDAIRRQMRQDQRPWIVVTCDDIRVSANQPVTTTVHIENTGKTPALAIVGAFMLDRVENGHNPDFLRRFEFGKKLTFKRRVLSRINVGSIFPNQGSRKNDMGVTWGEITNTDKAKAEVLSESDYTISANGGFYFAIHGWVVYRDGFDIHHWTQFCAWTSAASVGSGVTFTAGKCAAYNQNDNEY